MPKGRLVFDGDNLYTEKQKRIHKLTPEIEAKIDAIPGVVDSLDGTSTTDALSANMGRALQDQINSLSWSGNFLSTWNAVTWLPLTNPQTDPYTYKVWDYYIVSEIGATNYKPHWGTFTQWVPSTTIETETISVNDKYYFDWANWTRVPNTAIQISIDSSLSTTSTNAVENRAIANAINTKQNTISDLTTIRNWANAWATALQPNANITQLTNNAWYQTAWEVSSAINTAIQTLAPEWVWTWVLTLQKNSTTIDTFSANATQNKTIDISVPTTVAELTDASDYVTDTELSTTLNNYATTNYVDTSVEEAVEESKYVWPTAPSNPEEWQMWYDTTNNVLKVYDWTQWNEVWASTVYIAWNWIDVTNDVISIDTTVVATQDDLEAMKSTWSTPPSNPEEWQLWYDTTNDVLKVYDWTQWVSTWKEYTAWDWISINSGVISNTWVLSSNSTYNNIIYLSQADYDALQNKDANTLYSTPDSDWSLVDNTPFGASWDWDETHAPSKNAIYDVLWDVETLLANI